jgi:hypothetical protein
MVGETTKITRELTVADHHEGKPRLELDDLSSGDCEAES